MVESKLMLVGRRTIRTPVGKLNHYMGGGDPQWKESNCDKERKRDHPKDKGKKRGGNKLP